ncbi:hypothetical protein PR202_ga19047 [Eleusine coracana subsp. coracana]|uniref:non-specific serine/threonine protein kinase n=1 Tax=Eleusine coracana subsp. coracana TaxID=191504 RepID=A0AAV5CUQ9_ELECO|nr:hypothetical protein PR202_ga19047 [Eleusine coracana subsp. coracana]
MSPSSAPRGRPTSVRPCRGPCRCSRETWRWARWNKPSYITEWQIKGGNTGTYMSSNVSGQSSMAARAAASDNSSPFLSSVIDEGSVNAGYLFSAHEPARQAQPLELLPFQPPRCVRVDEFSIACASACLIRLRRDTVAARHPINIRCPYGAGANLVTPMLLFATTVHGHAYVGFRLSFSYGPRSSLVSLHGPFHVGERGTGWTTPAWSRVGGRKEMTRSGSSSRRHGAALATPLLLLLLLQVAAVRAQTTTDPTEAAAVNAVFAKLGQKASSAWNISGDPCTGVATDATNIDENPNFNPGIKCECTDQNNTVCHVTKLKIFAMDAVGQIPEELRNLTRLTNLSLGTNALTGSVPKELGNLANLVLLGFGSNNLNGSLPSELGDLVKLKQLYIDSAGLSGPLPASFSKLTSMTTVWASDNDFTGQIPDYIGSWTNLTELRFQGNSFQGPLPATLSNLVQLTNLFLGNNSLSGSLPSSIGPSLKNLDFSYNQLSGNFPSWITLNNMQLVLTSGLECLQRNTPCFLGRPQYSSFAVDCGSTRSVSGSDTLMYQSDDAKLGAASYFVTGTPTWGVSNVGTFLNASNGSYTIYSSRQFQNTLDPELFQTARMSPSSLRYYGVGLENGNYTVTLQFAEFDYEDSQTWKSVGRRVFDIYIQGERKEQNFDIRKAAGGKSYTAVKKQYTIPVTQNFLEIHLFWAGKGTCCIPAQGYYGPAISALSATPNLLADFTPTVRNATQKKSNSKTGVIVGMVVGAAVLGLVALAGLCMWRQKKRKLSLEQQELYSIVGRPNVFSYSELRTATESFSSNNLLGEGGYGSVYKGTLTDGRVVAVKQLSETSHQGKKEFATEIETISRVQHRNLVKLFGCCLEGNKPLLVYEYLENGSLDKALFGTKRSNLDWPTRFDICLCIGRGLAYLHEESSIRVVHRDIKASNVLLDANLNPKISDFGLAKLYDDKKTHVSTKVAGTLSGNCTRKSIL